MLRPLGCIAFMASGLLMVLPVGRSQVPEIAESLEIGADTCSHFGEALPDRLTTFASDKEAEDVIRSIISASGLAPNFEIRVGGVPNAAAVIHGGKRFIIYDQYFVESLNQKAGTKWAAVSVMAHEVGHHLNGHTLSSDGSRPRLELEADYYSGFILQKMGASIDESRRAMDVFGDPNASMTHPARHDRLAAITNGWTASCSSDANCKRGEDPNPRRGDQAPELNRLPAPSEDSCKYANDDMCDEPDLCDVGTDTTDCLIQPSSRDGFPSGYGMQVCGCWGFNPRPIAREPRCQSGEVRVNRCAGFCPTGGSPYAYVCR